MKRLNPVCYGLIALLLTSGCDLEDHDLIACDGTVCFSIEAFGDNIRRAVEAQTVGWAYVIYYDGSAEKWDQGGRRRASPDVPQIDMGIYDAFNMGSIGKTLTALGTLRALDQADVSLYSAVYLWIPPDWIQGPNIELITFRDLLTHESGLRVEGCHYDDVRAAIAQGIVADSNGVYAYRNLNFCYLRILIPHLLQDPLLSPPLNQSLATAIAYTSWMKQSVFTPAGLTGVDPFAPGHNPTLYYAYPHLGFAGINTATWVVNTFGHTEIEATGAGNWHLSPLQLASLMWQVAHTDQVISAPQRNQMFSVGLGIYTSSLTGGTAYHHNGGFNLASPLPYTPQMPAGARAVFYVMPVGVVATLVYNSIDFPSQSLDSPNAVVEAAYENAWVPDPNA